MLVTLTTARFLLHFKKGMQL